MQLLAFDTSTDVMSIGVGRDLEHQPVLWTRDLPGGAQASATLLPVILDLMREAGLGFADLDAIAFGCGPGAFTGLRTACAVAQGLAFGAQGLAGGKLLPVLPVDTLLNLAEVAREQLGGAPGFRTLALLDARMGEVYHGAFEYQGGCWTTSRAARLDVPAQVVVPPGWAAQAWVAAGNVFQDPAAAPDWPQSVPRVPALPQAAAMLRLAPALLAAGLAVPPELALPVYIRDKVAQTTQERLAAKAATLA